MSQQMQKIEVDIVLHIITDAAAFSVVTLETQASAGLKTNPYFVAAGCSLGLLQTDYDATEHVTESRAVSRRCGGAGKCWGYFRKHTKRHVNKAETEGQTSSVNHWSHKHSSVMFMFTKLFPRKILTNQSRFCQIWMNTILSTVI